MSVLDNLKYAETGLIPAIIQDAGSGEVLMFAFTNAEALRRSLLTGRMHFYSRSRKKLWMKGEESGHFQDVVEIRVDCDEDAVLVRVKQSGGACHTGFRSCFFRKLEPLDADNGRLVENGHRVFDPDSVYKKK
ncbi:MAG TPA: phosphoribosyl-AMP cyclohydrolase [Planctomycetes bacterium]|nr:phosphoribosyl-AMP cyclohydrolase [Planctomycetota bacterium]